MIRPAFVIWVVNGNRQIVSWPWYERSHPEDATPISTRNFAVAFRAGEGLARYYGAVCEPKDRVEVRTSA
ncbi:MAG TPA: hypothetical protein VHO25_23770, partial [Polyangiaceae bacterium]|nr:hypothetical protein [Polyangiaceae bacterium]